GGGPEAKARAGLAAAAGRGARALARSDAEERLPAGRDPAGAEGHERRGPDPARAFTLGSRVRHDPLGSEADEELAERVAAKAEGRAAGDRRRVRGDRYRQHA